MEKLNISKKRKKVDIYKNITTTLSRRDSPKKSDNKVFVNYEI